MGEVGEVGRGQTMKGPVNLGVRNLGFTLRVMEVIKGLKKASDIIWRMNF